MTLSLLISEFSICHVVVDLDVDNVEMKSDSSVDLVVELTLLDVVVGLFC